MNFSRSLIRSLLLLLVLAAVVPFVLPLKDGRPLLDWRKLKLPGLPNVELPEIPTLGGDSQEPSGQVVLYRWRDAGGETHFGDEPPAGVDYEPVPVDPNANIIQSVAPAPSRPPPAYQASSATPSGPVGGLQGATQALQDARNVEAQLEQHKARQDSAIAGMR